MTPLIRPLDRETLAAAIALIDDEFPRQQWWERARPAFTASLQPAWLMKLLLLPAGIRWCGYWAALDPQRTLLGVSGLYRTWGSPTTYGLGWTCVAPAARGRGVGTRLLERVIDEACRRNAERIDLYTTDQSERSAAVQMYERRGFVRIGSSPVRGEGAPHRVLYYRLHLRPEAAA